MISRIYILQNDKLIYQLLKFCVITHLGQGITALKFVGKHFSIAVCIIAEKLT